MYCLYLLAIFLLLGVDGRQSVDENSGVNDGSSVQTPSQNYENVSYATTDLTLTVGQSRELENALNGVARKFLGHHVGLLSLRHTEDRNASLARNVQIISNAICGETRRLFQRLGLARLTKFESSDHRPQNELGLKGSLYYHLLQVPLTLSPIFQQARTKIRNHFKKCQYSKMGYRSSQFALQINYGTSTDQLKISAFSAFASTYISQMYDCLKNQSLTSFDFRKAVGNLTNFAPEIVAQKLKIRLRKPIPKSPGKNDYSEIQAFICHGITENSHFEFRRCLEAIKLIEKCMNDTTDDTPTVAESSTKNSIDSLRTITGIDRSCENTDKGMGIAVGCKLKSKAAGTNAFPAVVQFFMGDTRKLPEIERMAKQIGSMIANSPASSEALHEVVSIIRFFKRSRAAQRDVRKKSIFSSMANVLEDFKKYIFGVTYKTIAHVHNVVLFVQKFLVDTVSTFTGEDISANVQALRSLSGFSSSVFKSWPQLGGLSEKGGSVESSDGEPLNKLIVSMKHLGQQSLPRRSTALISIANTFLLATMFYECLSLLAGVIYCADSNPVSPSDDAEAEESDHWQSSRDRRSPAPIDHGDFQPQAPMNKEKPSSTTNELEKTTMTTIANRFFEKNEASVGNDRDDLIPETFHTNEYNGQQDYELG